MMNDNLNETIRIRIQNHTFGMIAAECLFVVLGLILPSGGAAMLLFGYRAAGTFWLTAGVISLGLMVLFIYLAEYCKTDISADGAELRWRFLSEEHSVRLCDIESVICKPYKTYSRYGTFQRISLTVQTRSGIYQFNDRVDAAKVLEKQISGGQTEVPLIQLYRYLKQFKDRP